MTMRRFIPPDLSTAEEDTVGQYKLALVYRNVRIDGGPTIHVFGPIEGEQREILRFDCFRHRPHYHLGISYLDEPVHTIDAPDPLAWVLGELGQHFPDYLTRSKAECELPDNWQAMIEPVMNAFRIKAAELSPSAT